MIRIKRFDYNMRDAFINMHRAKRQCASGCNCSFCRSHKEDIGKKLQKQMNDWIRRSEEYHKQVAIEAERTKRLLSLTDRNKKRTHSLAEIEDYGCLYPNYRNL